MDAGNVLTLIGDIAAAAAAVFAYLALGKANQSIKEARVQRLATEKAAHEASQAAKDAAEDRQAANAEAKAARQEALEAARDASADRVAAAEFALSQRKWEREQHIAGRVERAGEIVEAIFWTASEERQLMNDPRSWWSLRNRLSQAIVGLREQLPRCAELINQHDSMQAFGVASQARNEIEIELKYLRHELDRPPTFTVQEP